ncbi:MAG: polysaccharide biosynthesis C-terminal domain-containing protein [Bacteroidales bacterium]|nr:polysaccharide biosynthesis C-terminal domain-containing protein [Bacteroidales bacterium]
MSSKLEGHFGYRRLVVSSLPLIGMMVLISVYSIVDGLFVSNLVGTTAFAALNLIWPAIGLVGALGLMVGTGGAALVSKTLGEGDPERARRYFSMFVEFILLLSVVLAVPLLIWMEPLSVSIGAEGEMVQQCVIYGRICAAGMPAFMMQMGMQPFFMVAGRPRMGTRVSLVSGLVNIGLDALFIIVFGWGLAGAAAGSMLACCVGGFYPLWFFSSRFNHTSLEFRATRFELRPLAKACSNGLSEFVGNISLNIVSMCYNWQLMRFYGENGVAAYSVILYLGFIFISVYTGYNMTVTPLAGFNLGAGNKQELRSLLRHSLVLMILLGVVLAGAAELLAGPAARLFVGYDDKLTALTIHATRLYSPSFLLSGITLFVSAWFTGLNNGPVSATVSFSRTFVFELSCVFLLPLAAGVEGIWLSAPLAEILSVALGVFLIVRYRTKYGY